MFYYDLTLPMGCSASCQLFERVSTAVQWIANTKLKCNMVHYLDDFFLASIFEDMGKRQLELFLHMCQDIGLPMAPEKTCLPSTVMSFVGYELDSVMREVRLPLDKLKHCAEEIGILLGKDRATLREIQSIVGLLNFACLFSRLIKSINSIYVYNFGLILVLCVFSFKKFPKMLKK